MLEFRVRSLMLTSLACAALVAPQLRAQSTTHSEWVASFGMDPSKMIGHFNPEENFVASLGRQWARANSGLGFRTQLSFGTEPSQTRFFNYPQCASCSVRQSRTFAELSGTAMYTFRRDKSFRPYLLAGPALYGVRSTYKTDGLTFGEGSVNLSAQKVWSLGGTVGVGFSLKLFGKELLVEQRYLTSETSTAARNAFQTHPLSIGVKF
jgi:hypothetical protein